MGHNHQHAATRGHRHGHDHGHDHDHNHDHDHDHYRAPHDFGTAFAIGIALNLGFVAIEALFGWWSHSLALLADAGHNLSDVMGLALAWGATRLMQRLPTRRHTYGLRRTTILASLANAMLLLFAVGAIAWEAIGRLNSPEPIASGTVMSVAAIGIVVNSVTAWLFASGMRHDVNIRGAFLHMAADAVVSLGVVLAALAIRLTGWQWLDPLTSLLIAAVIAYGTWALLRDSVNLALDAVPDHIDPRAVEAYLAELPGVDAVHDLHIWAMSTTEAALTVHLVKPDARIDDALLVQIQTELRNRFEIGHVTIQFERGDAAHPCGQAPMTVL